jgi:hypothetical protein
MFADMAELADALDLGSSVNRRAGSTPVTRTTSKSKELLKKFFFYYYLNIILYRMKKHFID